MEFNIEANDLASKYKISRENFEKMIQVQGKLEKNNKKYYL